MGDSRICIRGYPEVVVNSWHAVKFFIITTPTFHINFCTIAIILVMIFKILERSRSPYFMKTYKARLKLLYS